MSGLFEPTPAPRHRDTVRYKRFVIIASELKAGYEEHDSVEPVCTFLQNRRSLEGHGQCWVNVEGITNAEMDSIGSTVNLHDVTRKDCILEDTTISDEKWETIGDYLFVIADILRNDRQTTRPSSLKPIKSHSLAADMLSDSDSEGRKNVTSSRKWHTENINVVVFDGCVLSLHNYPFPRLANLITRVHHERKGAIPSADWILYAIFEAVLDQLVPLVLRTCDEVDELDSFVLMNFSTDTDAPTEQEEVNFNIDHSNHSPSHSRSSWSMMNLGNAEAKQDKTRQEKHSHVLQKLAVLRQRLAKLRSSFVSKREVLSRLCSQELPITQISPSVRIQLRACLDQVNWKLERVESAQETLRSVNQNLFSLVNLRVAMASQETNRVIKLLSLLLAITTPLTLVASVFGMNVYPLTSVHIVEQENEDPTLMIALITVMVGMTGLLLVLAQKNNYFT
jgi:Mg2+ and Co2+ transporter CorA